MRHRGPARGSRCAHHRKRIARQLHRRLPGPDGVLFYTRSIEIGGYPFPIQGYKPTREEAVEYYRGVSAQEKLEIHLYERVCDVRGNAGNFTVVTDKQEYQTRHVIVSTGFFDEPNLLNVPGEDLPKVTHYYREPYAYVRQKVAVIGARNSAAKAALDCYRHGAEVTLIVRSAALSDKVKYWIKPDLENRIKEGSIRGHFNTTVEEVRPSSLVLRTAEGRLEIDNDWVLAMTGYRPDYRFLEGLELTIRDDPSEHRSTTTPPSRPAGRGIYLAGTVCGGLQNRTLVHRERPVSRAPDCAAHRARERRADSVRSHPLEDGGVALPISYFPARPVLSVQRHRRRPGCLRAHDRRHPLQRAARPDRHHPGSRR